MISLSGYRQVLGKVRLFDNIGPDDTEKMLGCLGAALKNYAKDELILKAGDRITGIGIVLGGMVQIVKDDLYGKRSIMANIEPGDIFAEVLACVGIPKSPITAIAAEDAEVMFIGFERIVTNCPNGCGFHTTLIQNMLKIIAEKNLILSKKLDFIQIKSLRERIAAYLIEQSKAGGGAFFNIPFDRSGLADYLNADRSALSRELARMKEDGLIDYHKNGFKLLDLERLYDYSR